VAGLAPPITTRMCVENTPVFCFLPKRESLRLDESLTFALMLFGLGLPRCANFAFGMLNGCGEW